MWAKNYIGKKWTQKQDCGYWFRRIQKEQFNREIPIIYNKPNKPFLFLRNAMKLIKNKQVYFDWKETKKPIEGDAVILAVRTVPHHIGVVCYIDNLLYILHATESSGVILSNKLSLELNHFKIIEFLKYGN